MLQHALCRSAALCGLLLCLFGQAPVAYGANDSVYLKKFRALVQKGMLLTNARKFKRARVEIETALGLYQTSLRKSRLTPTQRLYLKKRADDLVYFIGRLSLYEKSYDRALAFCERVLHATFTKARFQAGVRRCYQAAFKQSAPKIEIKTQPPGARVLLKHARGQVYLGRTPFRQRVRPGAFRLTLRSPEHQRQEVAFTLVPGQTKKLLLKLKVPTKRAPPRRVAVRANVKARATPAPFLQRHGRLLLWSGVGLAVASLTTASVLMIVSELELQGVRQEASKGTVTQAEADARFQQASSLRYGGIVMLVVGGVLGAGVVGLVLVQKLRLKTPPKAAQSPGPQAALIPIEFD